MQFRFSQPNFPTQFLPIRCTKPGDMAKQFQAPQTGLPRKTFHTGVWLVFLGAGVVIFRAWTAPKDDPDATDAPESAAAAWSGPMETPSVPALPQEEFEQPEVGSAAGSRVREVRQPIEDPGLSMCPFYAALKKLDADSGDVTKVRILHYGDSILTTDQLSGTIRRKLQARFGDGGHGFVLLGRPWRWYHHLDVVHGANSKWSVHPLTSDPTGDGLMGLGAVAFESEEKNASAWAGTVDNDAFGRTVAHFDVSFLAQPRGGRLSFFIDEKLLETVSTDADEKKVVHHIVKVPPGPAKLTVTTEGDGPVRVFGAVLENENPGVVYDSLAINGARISNFERMDEAHFAAELRHRKADLVVMMCGANEGNNDALSLGAYKDQLAAVLGRIRTALPDAGCLVMGPLDQATVGEGGVLESKKMPKKLTRAQRETAAASGCAFFDTFSAMGGTGSMPKWAHRGLVGGDFIHPTETGARMIGSWLTEAILAGYENFVLNGEPCELNATSL